MARAPLSIDIDAAGAIGCDVPTGLGARYERVYLEALASGSRP